MSATLKAYTLLKSLRQNLPETYEVSKDWVDDYHSILDSIETSTGQSLKEFRVPDSDIHPQVTGGNYVTGQVSYGKLVVYPSRLLLKVDAVLSYYTFQNSATEKPRFGPAKT